jgi:spore coat protein U-like protein
LQFVGLHDEADFYTHKMADSGGTHFIRYILTGAATGGATMLFGEAPQKLGGNPTYNVSGTGTGAAQTMTITATAAVTGANSFQYAPQTSYSDTVTVTITF